MKIFKIVSVILFLSAIAYTQVAVNDTRVSPRLLNYQGYLTDDEGIPITDPALSMTFSIYDALSSGNQKWTETQTSVDVDKGVFSVILGSGTPIPDSVFNNTDRWLELIVGGQILTPRTRITSVGYAYTSTYSDTAEYARVGMDNDWVISGSDMYSCVSGNVGVGVTSPAEKLDVDGSVNVASVYRIAGHTMLSNVGLNNTFVGIGAGENSTTSSKNNTFLGDSAGYSNISGYNNTFLGHNAGHFNTTNNNTFVGTAAGAFNTTGGKNTFLGFLTGLYNTTGHDNTFSGSEAGLSNTTGYGNTFTGTEAGYHDTTGYCNTFTGRRAGYVNADGFKNTFSGYGAGYNNTSGRHNTFTGNEAGYYNTTGMYNVFTGGEAGFNDTSGISNTYLGYGAGYLNAEGDSNVFIGHHAGFSETGSNKLYIANGQDNANVLIYGEFNNQRVGIGTTSPTVKLDVNGDINAADDIVCTNMTALNDMTAVGGASFGGNLDVGMDGYFSGDLGIGASSPASKVHIAGMGANCALQIDGTGSSSYFYNDANGLHIKSYDGSNLRQIRFHTGSDWTPEMVILSSGKVGIGTTSPAVELDVNGTINADDMVCTHMTATGDIATASDAYVGGALSVDTDGVFDGIVSAASGMTTTTLDVNGSTGYNQIRMRTSYTPTGTSDPNGSTGDIAWDDSYVYIKTSAGWKRAQLGTW